MPFIHFGFGGQDDRRPDSGVKESAGAYGDGEEQEAGQGQDAGHGVKLGGKWARGQGDMSNWWLRGPEARLNRKRQAN